MVPLTTQVATNRVADIIKEHFRSDSRNFAGFRVLRNKDRYPETPIDGEIVFDGYAFAALDVDLDENQQYFYKVYTYDHFDRFSEGVEVTTSTAPLTIAARNAERQIPRPERIRPSAR
jgi:hypothetical protein